MIHLPTYLSRFIVKDPEICHGEPVFKGTQILVSDVLEQIVSGMEWIGLRLLMNGEVQSR